MHDHDQFRGGGTVYFCLIKSHVMKRIVLLIDALHFSPNQLDFAANIAKISGSDITGLFIHDTSAIVMVPELRMLAGQPYVETIVPTDEEKRAMNTAIMQNMRLFEEGCAEREVSGISQLERGVPLDIVLRESRYTDMMILSPSLTFSSEQATPSAFVKEVLAEAECPVLLSTEESKPMDEVVIAYDNTRSSVFAVKQFCYLLPVLCSQNITVLSISEHGKDQQTEKEEALFTNWLKIHCPNFTFVTLHGDPKDVLFNYFTWNDDNNKLLVAGAFGRNAISRFFKPGTTDLVLKAIDIPVFISHN